MAIANIQPRAINPLGLFAGIAGNTGLTMDATGESVALIGPIVWKDGVASDTKVLSAAGGGAIYIPFGTTLTWTSGSDLTVGLQDLSSGVEDGTFDVSGTFIAGTDAIVASRYNRFPMETGSKTVTFNQTLAIVAEMVTRVSADSLIIEAQAVGAMLVPAIGFATPYGTQDTGSGPAKRAAPCPFIIEFDDDTLGYCVGYPAALALRGLAATAVNNTSNPDEYGNVFTPTVPMRVSGLWAYATNVASVDTITLDLYTDPYGTPTSQYAAVVDVANQAGTGGIFSVVGTTGAANFYDLAAGTAYYVSIRPTSANNISLFTQDLGTGNDLLKQFSGLESVQLGTRLNSTGAVSNGSTSTIAVVGLWVTGLDDGAAPPSGGGGALIIGGGIVSG